MADAYWSKVVKRLFSGADGIREDWSARTVTFELLKPAGPMEIELPHHLTMFGNDARATLSVRADDRYKDQGELGVVATVTVRDVRFPEAPE